MGPLYCPEASSSKDDSSCMIVGENIDFTSITLDCPIGQERMKIPVVPKACRDRHLQCFCLE